MRDRDTANALSESLQMWRQDANSKSSCQLETVVWKCLDAVQGGEMEMITLAEK